MALEGVDGVFIALHGEYGEDGQIQSFLKRLQLPFTGSQALASASAFNKNFAKKIVGGTGVLTPKHKLLVGNSLWSVASYLDDMLEDLGTDLFVKPNSSGSSIGATRVFGKSQLEAALETLLPEHGEVLVEEHIAGKEATVSVLENFRQENHYALPAIEIIPDRKHNHFSYDAKYQDGTRLICPGTFTFEEKQLLTEAAIKAHTELGCTHYTRSDFIVRNGSVYFLEINTLPGLTEHSLLPHAANSVGLQFSDLVQHLLITARV